MTAALLAPVAPYLGSPADARPAQRPCVDCGADVMVERHVRTCPQLGEVYRMAFHDAESRRIEQVLVECTRRAWRAWVRAGYRFPGAP